MYGSDIPWVATMSMTVSLKAMHACRALYSSIRFQRTYGVNPEEHNPIFDVIKKIEMQRTSPVWGFCHLDEMIYLVEKDIYNAGENADLLEQPTTNRDWDTDIRDFARFDPTDPENIEDEIIHESLFASERTRCCTSSQTSICQSTQHRVAI